MTDHGATAIALPERRKNRPITPIVVAEYWLVCAILGVFRLIGVDAASAIAGHFMRQLGPMIRPLSKRAEINLQIAFPAWSQAEIRQTVRCVWENLGRTGAEYAHLQTLQDKARVRIIDADRFEALRARGGPIILFSGHLANWEMLSLAIKAGGFDYVVVYRAANNPLIDDLIIRLRAAATTRRLIPKGKQGGRALISALKAGLTVGMLVDQKLNDGIEAPFFGRMAMTAPAAARLALRFGAPLVPMSVVRTKGANFDVYVREPLAFSPTGNIGADTAALTAIMNAALEREISANPGQWLWLHRRWPKDVYEQ